MESKMTHGTYASYTHGCRCIFCRRANTERAREWTRRHPVERAGRLCLICGIALIDHPMKACWREMR